MSDQGAPAGAAPAAGGPEGAPGQASRSAGARTADDGGSYLGEPGPPLDHRAPFYVGFAGALGALLAYWVLTQVQAIGSSLVLIIVSLFLAAGLNPAVELIERRGVRRSLAVTVVIVAAIAAIALFVVAIVPVITDQVAKITDNAPGWLDQLRQNDRVQELDDEYQVIDKIRDYVTDGDFVSSLFGGAIGIGLAVLGALFNAFIIIVLTLYFLSSLEKTKTAMFRLAPASRRDRVTRLGNRILDSIGAYVSGAFVVALCAGITSLVFLFVVGLGEYAVALAFVVAVLDVIPMIGATIGAVVVCAIGFAEDPKIGIACVIFYVFYQQFENYVVYPRVMSRSVDVPGVVTVIAALIGASLLGVVGALMAIPTAAAILLIVREVFIRRQDAR
ncbi:AI-2E family transporter [Nocardioides sp. SYSU D00038]|uniref:AI-2E family transporter n=1 Tax=Nocardioides sp. SYSU D00038 TaxID=2812554 RepID=UPI0027DE7F6B|nr:AI-2E family transporter [Nocardioides sp. SYSU D00038]